MERYNYRHYECCDCTKTIDAAQELGKLAYESGRLLDRMKLNDFENLPNLLEEFLEGFEICDHTLHFDCIASMLESLLDSFDAIDTDHDGGIKLGDLQQFEARNPGKAQESEWLRCHFESLTKAAIFPQAHKITRDALFTAQRVFSGLAHVQHAVSAPEIGLEDLRRLQRDPHASLSDALAIQYLIDYLLKRNDDSISAGELDELSPEQLWKDEESSHG